MVRIAGQPRRPRRCHFAYHGEKLIWMDLTDRGRFAYDAGGTFCLDTTFVVSGQSLKYLCAVLNSQADHLVYVQNTALNHRNGFDPNGRVVMVERIPVPRISAARQRPLIRLVDGILGARASDPRADTAAAESELDARVCALYGLTAGEVGAVGGPGVAGCRAARRVCYNGTKR